MRIAISGAGGYVGGFVALAAKTAGHEVVELSRPAFALGEAISPALFEGCDAFVHCAFDHVPGKYRGGEGDDPKGFLRRNQQGSVAAFEAAKQAGVGKAVFLSSRAVYGDYAPGTPLLENMEPRPDTLYGRSKWQVEQAVFAMADDSFCPVSIRPTGVYGAPNDPSKWAALIAAIRAGEQIPPRCATEVHGEDLAYAVLIVLGASRQDVSAQAFNVSDVMMDRGELWALVTAETGCRAPKPEGGGCSKVNRMNCDKLKALGWQPGGWQKLNTHLCAQITAG